MKSAHPDLVIAQKAFDDSKANLESEKARVQAECPHLLIAHAGLRTPVRICFHCRLVEEGSHWSYSAQGHWSARDYGEAQLANSPARVVVDLGTKAGEIWKLRNMLFESFD